MSLESLDIAAPLKEKLKKLAVNILESELVKKEFSKPYYGHGSLC